MLYAKLIGRIALFTCENIAHIELYLQGLLPKILALYTIKLGILILLVYIKAVIAINVLWVNHRQRLALF